ncbi:nucleotidyl transferase AbiEii/AbiGii toxin family protein [Maribellus maritimus]|uniref:nucleotidyl transferase AbiEii/AbiGii toxin family protein n=1 Tax=Maribellus maritimus TaxID=2870838 RepID=UPI001EEB52A3|nr:nucleotidyl transferase AbiEii/AbiGii toxin family protein [Maribellus maritimus]MCG6189990.1 nucleotidyl transferase AbiEii/AbiGii toxin family protein [Maribellus maritimus]
MNNLYKEQVRLLLRILPIIYREEDFAVHGGTAINLFIKDLPRYSVDVDLTYIPLGPRDESLAKINKKLAAISQQLQRAVPNINIRPVPNKLLCTLGRSTVKIEVNGIKRGIIGATIEMPLCNKAQAEFGMYCKARIVPVGQLYGGKIAAALSRQHPRDLFDYNYMEPDKIDNLKRGFMFALLGSDKPFIESLAPHAINQQEALENQFRGMTDIPFTYENYETAREKLIAFINAMLSEEDKAFLISFEEGDPQWEKSAYSDFRDFPSVQWKLLNVNKLKTQNLAKHRQEVDRLKVYWVVE